MRKKGCMYMKNLIYRIKGLFSKKETIDISGALIGFSQAEKIHIIDLYNCYGVDAVINYLN